MMIIGVDYHPSFRQIAFFVEETGEYGEQRLERLLAELGIELWIGDPAEVEAQRVKIKTFGTKSTL
jgi:hypothetical protein